MLDAFPQDIHHAALGDLALETMQELLQSGASAAQIEGLGDLRLGVLKKRQQLGGIHGVIPVVVVAVAGKIARLVDQALDNQTFETFFTRIGRHHHPPSHFP